jgi:tRNA (mo5U34)-methyltransferase
MTAAELKPGSNATRLKREERFRIGPLELSVALNAREVEAIRRSRPFRSIVRPAVHRARGAIRAARKATFGTNGHTPVASKPLVQSEAPASPEARKIIDLIATHSWYHTIELPHGVVTPGRVDHRNQLHHYGLPEDMTGMRVLDVATYDGFWAFEFERRGAEVVAIDLASTADVDKARNWNDAYQTLATPTPLGQGFKICHELLGSKVKKEFSSVYDLRPERLGKFDIVFTSDLLIHLRDPLAAMEAIWTMTDRVAIFGDVFHPDLEGFKDNALVEFCHSGASDMWWRPSTACYRFWLRLARFSRIEEISRFVLQANFREDVPKVVFHAYP